MARVGVGSLSLLLLAAMPLVAIAQPSGALTTTAPTTRAAFEPDRLWLEPGVSAATRLRVEPASQLTAVVVEGPAQAQLGWSRTSDRLSLIGRVAGQFTLRARLGSGGPVLATLQVQVQAPLLERVIAKVRAEVQDGGRTPLVVFDLDDTLFDTRYRTLSVLRALGQARGEPRLAGLQLEEVHYEIEDTLAAAGFASGEIRGSLGRTIASYDAQRLAEYQLARPFPGAVEFVLRAQQAGARIAYVTGRQSVHRALSESVLRTHGFPVDGTLGYYRFDSQGTSASYKYRIVRNELPRFGEVVACFENEPANANAFKMAAPEAIHTFLDTQHSGGAPSVFTGIETIAGWRP